jgi:putative aldouronate transport system permease protein
MMNAFFVMIMRAFFQNSIPDSVIEAARIDGAGEWRVLRVIVLPMAKPMVATLTIMVGLMYWNDWMNGLYYVNKDSLYSIQVLLNRMLMDVQYLMTNANMSASDIGGNLPAVGIRMGVAVIGALPIMVVYPFFQRFFVKGIAIGAVKG